MGVIQKVSRFLLWSAVVALGQYEIVAKSPQLLDEPLPGWVDAARVERSVAYRPWTGLPPMDRLIHEGIEARLYYERLLR
jgi:hypothetical protein